MRYNVGDKVVLSFDKKNIFIISNVFDDSYTLEGCVSFWTDSEIDHEATLKLKESKMNLIEALKCEEGTKLVASNGKEYVKEKEKLYVVESKSLKASYPLTTKDAYLTFEKFNPITLTDDEKVILRCLDEQYKWIYRDKIFNGMENALFLCEEKPIINSSGTSYQFNEDIEIPYINLFKGITFENSPLEISELLK